MLTASLALIVLIPSTAASLAQDEPRPVRVHVRGEAEAGRDGVGVTAEPTDRGEGPLDAREQVERRLAVAERLLDRAAVELERERPGRAMALIRAARSVLREPQARERGGRFRRGDEARRADVRSEERAEPSAEGRGTIRVEIRTRTRGEDGKEDEKVEVREYRIGHDGRIQTGEGQEVGVRVVPGRGLVEAIRQLERLTCDRDEPVGSQAAPPAEDDKAEAVAEPKPEPAEDQKPVGIGVLLEEEDGEFVVRGVLPDGPAAREGSIRDGDRLVGAYSAEGAAVMFEGKPLAEVVGMIRGEAGTSIRLIVKPAGSEEEREVELVRQALRVPEDGE